MTYQLFLDDERFPPRLIEMHREYAVIEMCGQYGNIHDVPRSVVDRMASAWESYDGSIKIGKKS